MLDPVIEALRPIAKINVESQVLIFVSFKLSYLIPFLVKLLMFLLF